MTAESRFKLHICPSDEVTLILFPAGLLGVVEDGGLLEGFGMEEGGVLEVGVVLAEEGGVTGDLEPEYFLLFWTTRAFSSIFFLTFLSALLMVSSSLCSVRVLPPVSMILDAGTSPSK